MCGVGAGWGRACLEAGQDLTGWPGGFRAGPTGQVTAKKTSNHPLSQPLILTRVTDELISIPAVTQPEIFSALI